MDHIDDLKKQLDEDFTATQASNPEEIQGFEGNESRAVSTFVL